MVASAAAGHRQAAAGHRERITEWKQQWQLLNNEATLAVC